MVWSTPCRWFQGTFRFSRLAGGQSQDLAGELLDAQGEALGLRGQGGVESPASMLSWASGARDSRAERRTASWATVGRPSPRPML